MRYSLMLILLGISSLLFAQKEAPDIRHGNRDYNKDNFAEAEVDYRRGLEKNNQSYEAHYNLGDALFRQNKYPEAAEEFMKAAQVIDPKKDKQKAAKTYHNLGNSLFAQQQYDKAITAYQRSNKISRTKTSNNNSKINNSSNRNKSRIKINSNKNNSNNNRMSNKWIKKRRNKSCKH